MPEAAEAQADPLTQALVGRTFAEKFRIEAFVGKGAMGSVYRATQLNLKKSVAIKVMHPDKTDGTYARASSERPRPPPGWITRTSLRVIDFGEEPDGLLYIAMEFLDGKDLLTVLREEFPLSTERIVEHPVAGARRARRRARDGGHPSRPEAREHHAPPVEGRRGAADRAREGVRLRHREDHPRSARRRGRARRDSPSRRRPPRRPARSRRTARSSARPSTCRPSRRAASRPTREATSTRSGSSSSS